MLGRLIRTALGIFGRRRGMRRRPVRRGRSAESQLARGAARVAKKHL